MNTHSPYFRPFGFLVVDNDPFALAVLAAGLRQRGFKVWAAATHNEAVQLYQRHHPDIDAVLLDFGLPMLDGANTVDRLQQIQPDVYCWFMAGAGERFREEELLRCGACGVLRKPFHLTELVDQLSKQLGPLSKAFVFANPGGIHGRAAKSYV